MYQIDLIGYDNYYKRALLTVSGMRYVSTPHYKHIDMIADKWLTGHARQITLKLGKELSSKEK